MRLVCVGECTRDRYVEQGVDHPGGISLNFAVHARGSGASEVAIVSCIGSDTAGDAVTRRLALAGIDAARLRRRPGATATQAIEIGAGGERTFPPGGYDPGVLSTFRLDETDRRFIGTFDVVSVPYFRQIEQLYRPALEAAPRARHVVDLLDGADLGPDLAGIESLLEGVDIAFISGGQEIVELLAPRARGARPLIVVTHGPQGSTAIAAGHRFVAPAVDIPHAERADTTGCGDAFQAAFTVAYVTHGDIQRALGAGAARAARVIRHLGATIDEDGP